MSTVYYPSIYDNTYKYAELANNSIVITTQSGFGAVAAESNSVIICNENGQWITSSLDNYATSSDITNIQNSIDTLSTYSDILQQSIYSNLTAINTLQTNLTNNYFTKDEITSSSDMLTNMLGETFNEISREISILSDDVTTISNDVTTLGHAFLSLSNDVQILSEDIIWMEWDFGSPYVSADEFDGFFNREGPKQLSGVYKLYGTVTLYIEDITKMTPKVSTLTQGEWVDSLPRFEISLINSETSRVESVFEEIIEANRSLITIPVNALITGRGNNTYEMMTNIILPEPDNINITVNDFMLLKYNLYLERINRGIFEEKPQE